MPKVPMDYTDRVRELAASAGLRVRRIEEPPPPDRCWIDARVSCPYGSPEGQFINRPEGFCNGQCPTFGHRLKDILDDHVSEQEPKTIRAHFKEHHTSVSAELEAQADTMPEGATERLALELAADVLRDQNRDQDILLEDDLPEE